MKKNTALYAMSVALAFLFSYIESLLPNVLPIPGMKLGLANIILILFLYKKGFPHALSVSILRNVLTALTFGNLTLLLFSFAGSFLSLSGMAVAKRFGKWSVPVVSCLGGILHNMGQLLAAGITIPSNALLGYMPILYFTGMATGLLIGFVSNQCLRRLPASAFPPISNKN